MSAGNGGWVDVFSAFPESSAHQAEERGQPVKISWDVRKDRVMTLVWGQTTPVTVVCVLCSWEDSALWDDDVDLSPWEKMSCYLTMGLAFRFVPAHLLEQVAPTASSAGLGCPLQFRLHPWG